MGRVGSMSVKEFCLVLNGLSDRHFVFNLQLGAALYAKVAEFEVINSTF